MAGKYSRTTTTSGVRLEGQSSTLTAVLPDVLLTDHEYQPLRVRVCMLYSYLPAILPRQLAVAGIIAHPGTQINVRTCRNFVEVFTGKQARRIYTDGKRISKKVSDQKANRPVRRLTTTRRAQGSLEQLYGIENDARSKKPFAGTATDTSDSDSVRPTRQRTRRDGKVVHLAKATVRTTR